MKALFVSAWRSDVREYDIARWKKASNLFSLSAPMTDHFGLRFLAGNVPGLKIIDYPTREQFLAALKEGWDVVGISFYINESNDAVEMAHTARAYGVPQVWAGNYGAFTPWLAEHFDRVFVGWSEASVCAALGLEKPAFRHPPVYMQIRYRGLPLQKWGVLFTSRGCNKTCTFCQTPAFYRAPLTVDTGVLAEVLDVYQREGVKQVIVLDENFGHFHDHSRQVIGLIHERGLRWNPLTRVEALYQNYDDWVASGLAGASLGVESLNQDSLDGARKGNQTWQARHVLRRMQEDGLLAQVFYIIGFENDTVESVTRDILELKTLAADAPQIQILTPYPNTRLYKTIEARYGILDRNLAHYDSTHLVWNHPHIAPERMRELLFWANRQLYDWRVAGRTLGKMLRQNVQHSVRRRRGSGRRTAGLGVSPEARHGSGETA